MMDALTAASLRDTSHRLVRRDAVLRSVVMRHGPPPLWPRQPGFRTLARMILEQQVSLDSAATLFRRLDRSLSGGLNAVPLARAGPPRAAERLRRHGVTRQKAGYLAALAERVASRPRWLAAIARQPDDEATAELMSLPGIGPWTANVYLLFALRRPDVWPSGDLAIHIALGELLGRARPLARDEADAVATRWTPHRATAARIIWHGYLSDRGRA
jgi:DNA-3-methyladenine glycosylase II